MQTRTCRRRIQTAKRGIEYVAARVPPVKQVYWRYAPSYYRWRIQRRIDHGAPLDPLKLVWIDPNELSQFSSRENSTVDRWRDIARVRDGDWDQHPPKRSDGIFFADRLEDTVLYNSCEKHFTENTPWKETKLFQSVIELLDSGKAWRGCRSRADVIQRCNQMDILYDRMQVDGYKTQRELFEDGKTRSDRVGYLDLLTDEITIDIGRNGELLFVDGRHRACLAKILELPSVPVFILTRHHQWMQLREKIYQSGSQCALAWHPDLVEIE